MAHIRLSFPNKFWAVRTCEFHLGSLIEAPQITSNSNS
jgi:hypothetical protein